MPLAESNTAATITFDAAVHRALARRLSDTPYPRKASDTTNDARTTEAAGAIEAAIEPARPAR